MLEVYLVPVGTAKYELYCETPDDDDEPDDGPAWRSASRGLYARFREMMEEAQEARRAKRLVALSADPRVTQSWAVRFRNWVISWIAETIADWRLLWLLRTRRDATLLHPADLDGAAALDIARSTLQRDANRHRLWFIIDGVLAGILGLLFIIPGLTSSRTISCFAVWGTCWLGAVPATGTARLSGTRGTPHHSATCDGSSPWIRTSARDTCEMSRHDSSSNTWRRLLNESWFAQHVRRTTRDMLRALRALPPPAR